MPLGTYSHVGLCPTIRGLGRLLRFVREAGPPRLEFALLNAPVMPPTPVKPKNTLLNDVPRPKSIGGWGNTQDAVESDGVLDSKPSHVETGRWYDIKLTVAGKHVKCWLDGELIHDIDSAGGGGYNSLFATAATDAPSGDIIVKVVNTQAEPLEASLSLTGANLAGAGTATVLTSENAADENSLDAPAKVSPKTEPVTASGPTFARKFAGNSFTVLRLPTRK